MNCFQIERYLSLIFIKKTTKIKSEEGKRMKNKQEDTLLVSGLEKGFVKKKMKK